IVSWPAPCVGLTSVRTTVPLLSRTITVTLAVWLIEKVMAMWFWPVASRDAGLTASPEMPGPVDAGVVLCVGLGDAVSVGDGPGPGPVPDLATKLRHTSIEAWSVSLSVGNAALPFQRLPNNAPLLIR